jgi:hypothetical protein
MIYAEQRLDISFITTEKGAEGTSDVVIVKDDRLIIVDLKYGMGVRVDAKDNEQLLIYGAAALEKYDLLGEIKTLEMVISQPRLDHVSKWELPASEVKERLEPIKKIAIRILSAKGGDKNLHATPGEKQCKFCRVKATCPEYRGLTLTTVTDDFVDLDKEDQFLSKVENATERLSASDDKHLATCWTALDLIENWCKAVRTEVDRRVLAGEFTDDRIKVVQGKRGNRAWVDETKAYYVLGQHFDDDFILDQKLKSPTKIKDLIYKEGKEVWTEVEPLITQTEGRPIVVLATDKRPALDIEPMFEKIEDDVEFTEALVGLTKEGIK